ncbi:hypothetical protein [Streptomyces mirabilis]|uniref:PH domain-containing protein n=1 Tax=Streptomyces mirabilis TaxID=68239 RepID=A0A1I2DEN9_9ACTN|nr:hypothetical protein [Streptomyces mirabilis]SFE79006.1 hypothetical protein SAMN02787118_102634 [Streptomyces mirabilis]
MRIARALLRHELRLFASLLLWVTRRAHGTRAGRPFGHARGQGAMMWGLGFVCVVETAGMAVLLRGWPVVHAVVLVLDVYTVLMVVGMHAAGVTRPHILDSTHLRVRNRAHVDLRIPLADIAVVRRELRTTHERAEGELNLAVGAQTDVTLELATPVPHFTFLGRERRVRLVRLHADDPDELVRALTQARTAPSRSPGRPG